MIPDSMGLYSMITGHRPLMELRLTGQRRLMDLRLTGRRPLMDIRVRDLTSGLQLQRQRARERQRASRVTGGLSWEPDTKPFQMP